MRIYIDLDSLSLIESPGIRQPVTEIRAKRGTSKKLELQFVRGGEPELLPVGTVIRFGPKESGKYDGDFIVFADTFTPPGGTEGFYEGTASFNTEQLNALLGSPDGTTTNDKDSVTLMSEFSWQVPGEDPEKTDTFNVIVANAVDSGNEAAPSEAGPNLNTRLTTVEGKLDGTAAASHLKAQKVTIDSEGTPALTVKTSGSGGSPVMEVETTNGDFIGPLLRVTHFGSVICSLNQEGELTLSKPLPIASGGTGQSSKPYVSVRPASASQLFVNSVDAKVVLDDVETDAAEIWDAVNSRVIMPRAGLVQFSVTIVADAGAWYLRLKKNGATDIILSGQFTFANNCFGVMLPVEAGDFFELWGQQNSTNRYIYGGASATRLGLYYLD